MSDPKYTGKYKIGDKVRVVAPAEHPTGAGQTYTSARDKLKVGKIYVVDQNYMDWAHMEEPNIRVRGGNGHCQPERIFREVVTNEERMQRRKEELRNGKA